MWCANCNADVAAEVSPDDQRVRCAVCRTDLGTPEDGGGRARDARRILERWSADQLLEPDESLPTIPPDLKDLQPVERPVEENPLMAGGTMPADDFNHTARATGEGLPPAPGGGVNDGGGYADDRPAAHDVGPGQDDTLRREVSGHQDEFPDTETRESVRGFRILHSAESHGSRFPDERPDEHGLAQEDPSASHQSVPAPKFARRKPPARKQTASASAQPPRRRVRIEGPAGTSRVTATADNRSRTQRPPVIRHFHDSERDATGAPHFQLEPVEKRANWSVIAGQWLAYVGVIGLTVGTAIVVYAHFGGHSEYTPTGWLITTVGQMLLFLGVINLVSGGMEQSNDQVFRRIDMLGEHILRIENGSQGHELRGPKISVEHYAGEEVRSPAHHHRQTVDGEIPGLS